MEKQLGNGWRKHAMIFFSLKVEINMNYSLIVLEVVILNSVTQCFSVWSEAVEYTKRPVVAIFETL